MNHKTDKILFLYHNSPANYNNLFYFIESLTQLS